MLYVIRSDFALLFASQYLLHSYKYSKLSSSIHTLQSVHGSERGTWLKALLARSAGLKAGWTSKTWLKALLARSAGLKAGWTSKTWLKALLAMHTGLLKAGLTRCTGSWWWLSLCLVQYCELC